jgi:hypothetical protein
MGIMWKKFQRFFTLVGYARAASALAQMGYYEEAKCIMLQRDKFKNS